MLAMMLLLMPFRWLSAAIVAAVIHELCHYAAIRLITGSSSRISLYSFGAMMTLPAMPRSMEMLCAFAGPIGGLLLTSLAAIFPRLAICAMLQSIYNLLPIYPLDGGRALGCILSMYLPPPKAAAVLRLIGVFCKILLIFAGCYVAFILQWGILPLLFVILTCIRIK